MPTQNIQKGVQMQELLEAAMLICFGLSWPISLVKNIRVHSAKGMSFKFNLLILVGYVAGIGAKFYLHAYNYVFFIYLLNLAFVSANMAVYFINKSCDQKAVARETYVA